MHVLLVERVFIGGNSSDQVGKSGVFVFRVRQRKNIEHPPYMLV